MKSKTNSLNTNFKNSHLRDIDPKGLYVITHHDDLTIEQLISDITATLMGGASTVQFRDKTSSKEEKLKRALALQTLCKNYKTTFLINDDIELCKKINADGVHLGLSDTSINEARDTLGSNKIIGSSCHDSLELALQAKQRGADYIALGRFFASKTKTHAPQARLENISIIKKQCNLPIVAIGGITLDNAPTLISHQIDAIAVINDLLSQQDIKHHSEKLCSLFT